MDTDGFFAAVRPDHGRAARPAVPAQKTCCWWSGQSWPYATTQTLKAMANLLQDYDQNVVTRADYLKLLPDLRDDAPQGRQAVPRRGVPPGHRLVRGARQLQPQRALLPLGFNDLVITGLVGLRPRDDDTLEVEPAGAGGVGLLRARRRAVPRPPSSASSGTGRHALRARARGCSLLVDGKEIAASREARPADGEAAGRGEAGAQPPRRPRQLRGEQRRRPTYPRVTASYSTRARRCRS